MRIPFPLGNGFELWQVASDEYHAQLPVLFAPGPLASDPFIEAPSGVSVPGPEGGCIAAGAGEVAFQAAAEVGSGVFAGGVPEELFPHYAS